MGISSLQVALSLLRRRPQFRALWTALAISYTGGGAAATGLTLYVQQEQGTAEDPIVQRYAAPTLLRERGGAP